MKQIITYILAIMSVLVLFSLFNIDIHAQSHDTELECNLCHTCEVPTKSSPCLITCPSYEHKHRTSQHTISEAPDTIVLGYIAKQFEAVQFDHKSHANMALMNLDCATCHHYSVQDRIPPCRECHGSEDNPVNLQQPSLKAAYHRQCMGCHREWSHDTKCIICHTPCEETDYSEITIDETDIVGKSHPVITVPTTKIYHTPYEPGPIVTFYHDEHVDLFGFQCVDCHIEENCSYCHDLSHPVELAKTEEEKHAICTDCHLKDNCGHCHDHKRKPAFSHNTTGWPLNQYHNKLECRACHPTRKKIAKLDNHCNSCHGGWNQENFRHSITGLILDENHSEWECTDCHPESMYNKPTCSGCHDDDITPENNLPGKFVKKR